MDDHLATATFSTYTQSCASNQIIRQIERKITFQMKFSFTAMSDTIFENLTIDISLKSRPSPDLVFGWILRHEICKDYNFPPRRH